MGLKFDQLSVESLKVGELGDRIVEVHESILSLSFDLSADMVSQLTFKVSDPYLRLHNNNYFMIGRSVTYGDYKFEIAAVDIKFGRGVELGDRLVQVHESIQNLNIDLSADMVSQLTFTVIDPYLKLHNNNYFMIGRTVTYGDYKFEIAAIDVKFGGVAEVNVTARSQATQKLRREKGNKNFGSISPSTFAAQAAARVGLSFFGENSPADGQIKRVQKDNQDESTFDMLKKLANKNEFRFFEANNTMFFASEEFIVKNQGKFEIHLDLAGLGTLLLAQHFFPPPGKCPKNVRW